MAVMQLIRNCEFAASVGAPRLVIHAGRVPMRSTSQELMDLSGAGFRYSKKFTRRFEALLRKRARKVRPYLDALRRSLDELLPCAESAGVAVCIENLPSWETLPCETEFLTLQEEYDTPFLRYWHDVGHAMIRDHLGFIDHRRWAKRLLPVMAGVHIHQSNGADDVHQLAPSPAVARSDFPFLGQAGVAHVLEPSSALPAQALADAIRDIRSVARS